MKKLIVSLLLLLALGTSGVAGAAPVAPAPSAYADYLQTLDALTKSAIAPPAQNLDWPRSGAAGSTIAIARSLLGRPVVWGGASPADGFDCSGLVQYVFRQAGINLPRTADLQFLVGRTVSPSALRPGDLVYYTTYEPGASHVGIYIGADKFIHTSYSKGVVAIADINDSYFVQRFYGAKRIG
jgi:cell wall-associated NlpC family hydrolase